jgi:hypothetical protein
MIRQEKGDLLIQVTAWAGLTVFIKNIMLLKRIKRDIRTNLPYTD